MIPFFKVSEFYRHVGVLLSGSTVAQLIPLVSELILVRLFTPAEFGVLALFLSAGTLFAAIATARYDLAIVLPKTQEDAINVLALSLFVTIFIVTPLSAIVVWLFPHTIAEWMDSQKVLSVLPWVPLFVLLSGVYAAFFQWSTRRAYFRTMAVARISQSAGTAVTSIATGLLRWRTLGLVVGQIMGWAMGVFRLVLIFRKRDRAYLQHISVEGIRRQAKRYIQFPTVNSAHVLSDVGQQSLSSVLIARFFSEATLGFYSRMIRIVKVPMGFIGTSVGQVFFQEASKRWNHQQPFVSLYIKNLKLMMFLGLPIFGILAIWGSDIFSLFLGAKWSIAGTYASYLSLGLFSNFVVSPFSTLPLIAHKQIHFFVFSLIANTMIVLSFVVTQLWGKDITTALLLVSLVQFLFNVFLGVWFYRLIKSREVDAVVDAK